MHWIEWLVIGVYISALICVVWWSSRKQNTSKDYFLAGRNIGWFAVAPGREQLALSRGNAESDIVLLKNFH